MNILMKSPKILKFDLPFCYYLSTKIADNIKNLVEGQKVVVFMKGVPEQPRCGFSNAVVQIMRMHGVKYEAHDVLQDEDLRQGDYILSYNGEKPICVFLL